MNVHCDRSLSMNVCVCVLRSAPSVSLQGDRCQTLEDDPFLRPALVFPFLVAIIFRSHICINFSRLLRIFDCTNERCVASSLYNGVLCLVLIGAVRVAVWAYAQVIMWYFTFFRAKLIQKNTSASAILISTFISILSRKSRGKKSIELLLSMVQRLISPHSVSFALLSANAAYGINYYNSYF